MNKIHIEQATNEQLNYAVASALGLELRNTWRGIEWVKKGTNLDGTDIGCFFRDDFSPTTDQEQCGGLLIDKLDIATKKHPNGLWQAEIYSGVSLKTYLRIGECFDKIRLVAACKAYLWSVYPDGLIPCAE